MKSNQIIKSINKTIDDIQDDIEESKKSQNIEAFIYCMKALREMKYALDLAKKYIVVAMTEKK